MGRNLRVVLAGCGGMSKAWLNTATKIEGLEVVGLVDIVADAARARRDEYGLTGAGIYTDLDEALRESKPDILFDVTIPEVHTFNALSAFAHGVHVLSEKPMSHSIADAQRALDAAQAAGVQYSVMQNRRFQRQIRRVRELVRSGVLGELTTVNVDFYVGAHFGGFRDRMEHVLLLDMAIHTFDALRYLSGADAEAVYCREWNPAGSWYDHDASAVAIFEMTHGITATYRGSWCAEGLRTTWESDWRLIGTRGSARWDGGDGFQAEVVPEGAPAAFMRVVEPVELPELDTTGFEDGHDSCIRNFVEAVCSGAVPETPASDNIKSLAMVFGAIASAEAGRRQVVDSDSG